MKKFRLALVALIGLSLIAIPALSSDAVAAKKPKKKAFTIKSGTTKLVFDAAFIKKLTDGGVLPTAIAPASQDAATLTLTVPVSGGTVNKSGSKVTVKHSGGFQLQNSGGVVRTLKNIQLKLNGKNIVSSAVAGSATAENLLTLNVLQGKAGTVKKTNKSITISGGKLTLGAEAAQDLNTQFFAGQPTFAAGETLGVGSTTAKK